MELIVLLPDDIKVFLGQLKRSVIDPKCLLKIEATYNWVLMWMLRRGRKMSENGMCVPRLIHTHAHTHTHTYTHTDIHTLKNKTKINKFSVAH